MSFASFWSFFARLAETGTGQPAGKKTSNKAAISSGFSENNFFLISGALSFANDNERKSFGSGTSESSAKER